MTIPSYALPVRSRRCLSLRPANVGCVFGHLRLPVVTLNTVGMRIFRRARVRGAIVSVLLLSCLAAQS